MRNSWQVHYQVRYDDDMLPTCAFEGCSSGQRAFIGLGRPFYGP